MMKARIATSIFTRRFFLYTIFFLPVLIASAQEAKTDSLVQDSLNRAFIQQAKMNAAAAGQDTTKFNKVLAADTLAQPVARDSATVLRDSVMQVKKAKRHSPKKAALFSLALPGLGQAYNKKYWKIPIIYAGFGGLSYAIYYTASNFYGFRNAYRAQVADPPNPNASYKGVSDPASLKLQRDYFKRNLDVSVVVTGLWYLLNIIDATVDAHLFEWNMRDDLNVSWRPSLINTSTFSNSAAAGVNIRLTF